MKTNATPDTLDLLRSRAAQVGKAKMRIVELQYEIEQQTYQLTNDLIANGLTDCLTINWRKLNNLL